MPEHSEIMYLSPDAKFGDSDAIRGGIPVCFPQFGPKGFGLPQHGFARKSNDWELANGGEQGHMAEFVLRDTEATRSSSWPHLFELRYQIMFDAEGELVTRMRLRNTGRDDFKFTCALHSYFCVDDITQTTVEGLSGVEYEDALDEANPVKTEDRDVIDFAGNVDRVYGPSPLVVRMIDGKKGRCVAIAKDFPDVVVWNPWDEKTKAMGDMPDDDYKKFVCIEVGAIREPVTVKAGEEWTASQKITISGN